MAKRLLIVAGVLLVVAVCLAVLLTGHFGTGFDDRRADEIDSAWRTLEATAGWPGPALAGDGPSLADHVQTVLALAREPRRTGWRGFRDDVYRIRMGCQHGQPPTDAVEVFGDWLARPGPKPLALGGLEGLAREELMLDLDYALTRVLDSARGAEPDVQRGLYALARSLVDEPGGRRWSQLGVSLLIRLLQAQAERAPLAPSEAVALLPPAASFDAALCRAALDDAAFFAHRFTARGLPGMLGSNQLIEPLRGLLAARLPLTDRQREFLHTALKQRLVETVFGTLAPTGSATAVDGGLAMITLDPDRGVDLLGAFSAGLYVEVAALQQVKLLEGLDTLGWPRPELLAGSDGRARSGSLIATFVDGR